MLGARLEVSWPSVMPLSGLVWSVSMGVVDGPTFSLTKVRSNSWVVAFASSVLAPSVAVCRSSVCWDCLSAPCW